MFSLTLRHQSPSHNLQVSIVVSFMFPRVSQNLTRRSIELLPHLSMDAYFGILLEYAQWFLKARGAGRSISAGTCDCLRQVPEHWLCLDAANHNSGLTVL